MSVTLPLTAPDFEVVTTGLANVLTEVIVPREADTVTFRARTNAGKVVFGTPATGLVDGGALGAAKYVELPAGVTHGLSSRKPNGGREVTRWFVTSTTPSTEIEVVVEAKGVL